MASPQPQQPEPSEPSEPSPGSSAESAPTDPRVLLANERTFLAWMRTSLALLAAAAAVTAVDLPMSLIVQRTLSVALAVIALVTMAAGWHSWRRREEALHRRQELPPSIAATLLVTGMFLVSLVLIVAVLT